MTRGLARCLSRTTLALALVLGAHGAAQAQGSPAGAAADSVILDMQQAFRRGDTARLTALLPQARGHVLEPWAAYWELKARLETTATDDEVRAFEKRWAGSYQEDRLRNDWLLVLGKRRDFAKFAEHHPAFRMQDDRNVRCYALAIDQSARGANTAAELRKTWLARQQSPDDACDLAAGLAFQAKVLQPADLWAKARLAIDAGQPGAARSALELLDPTLGAQVTQLQGNAARFLASSPASPHAAELQALALIRLASTDADQAASAMATYGAPLPAATRDWVWAAIARRAALNLSDTASAYARQVTQSGILSDDWQEWLVRVALRSQDWAAVRSRIEQMPASLRQQADWTYWLGRAHLAAGNTSAAQQAWRSVAKASGDFYEKLAHEELGQRIPPAPAVPPPSADALRQAAQNPSLQRALYAMQIGLRSEGVREWNYAANLHTPGGMNDRERHAAAALACQREIWDRCINTSDRIRSFSDTSQRFPTPYRNAVVTQSRAIKLDPAYVYGLIRQESRFIIAARSGVGAQGLMQVMPATARWTARKIGLSGYTNDQLYDMDTNILLGTHYLKLALDDFQDSMPLAAAAYNAGPGRPRSWRNGPTLEGAIWAETIPFSETRHYVKAVLANAVDYGAMLSGQPQSLKARLGTVGPLATGTPDPSRDLP
ncbi:lytic transglycosylase [Comamonas serinivorans]|uniref:Lytic transglycosylase n=1 Tax=Comamonas serinivorans TaxID=1082851 RepID=A0A1Y0EQZ6_9BURK|nr:lytic transglycosylase domain-containing protein [Comamonas serinivorans]ARU06084.1 lytic transglycosylase [Comamonas serinivorans]